VQIHQDADLCVLDLSNNQTFSYSLKSDRMAWVQAARGSFLLNDLLVEQGDGLAITDENIINFKGLDTCEILIFDLKAL
jgi:redox-sensitive bicupin YhaK (pirin superfamily)